MSEELVESEWELEWEGDLGGESGGGLDLDLDRDGERDLAACSPVSVWSSVGVLGRLDNELNEANSDTSVRASEESPSARGLTVLVSLALDLVVGVIFRR